MPASQKEGNPDATSMLCSYSHPVPVPDNTPKASAFFDATSCEQIVFFLARLPREDKIGLIDTG